jgi:hypothetical protein
LIGFVCARGCAQRKSPLTRDAPEGSTDSMRTPIAARLAFCTFNALHKAAARRKQAKPFVWIKANVRQQRFKGRRVSEL